VDFDKTFWPSAADMDALRQKDDWWRVAGEHFFVDNIRKYFARSPPLSAQDADRCSPREHVAFLFSKENEEFHNLIRNHIVMPFVIGDFFPGHSEEVIGGKYCALVKPNANGAPIPNAGGASVDADVRGIVISSTSSGAGRCCSASHAVDDFSLSVADYLLGQYDNFFCNLQGRRMGRLAVPKSCNCYWQIMLIMMCLIPLWLYSSMLPTFFALCPGNLNSLFCLVRHPVLMMMEGFRWVTNSLDRAP